MAGPKGEKGEKTKKRGKRRNQRKGENMKEYKIVMTTIYTENQKTIKMENYRDGKLVKTAERTESLDLSKETLKIKEFLKRERKK